MFVTVMASGGLSPAEWVMTVIGVLFLVACLIGWFLRIVEWWEDGCPPIEEKHDSDPSTWL